MPVSRKRKNRGKGTGAQERRRRIRQRNDALRTALLTGGLFARPDQIEDMQLLTGQSLKELAKK